MCIGTIVIFVGALLLFIGMVMGLVTIHQGPQLSA